MIDTVILAGGYGTRLRGVWDSTKCLAPFKGRPLIEHLVNLVLPPFSRQVFLLIGWKASAVVEWRENCCPHRALVPIIETDPRGTASAIRYVAPLVRWPLLVMNGDTIPFYDLGALVAASAASAADVTSAWCRGAYAGAAVLSERAGNVIRASSESNLDMFTNGQAIMNTLHFGVADFLDVGTPEGFRRAAQFKETKI